jgi:hypothetical protein
MLAPLKWLIRHIVAHNDRWPLIAAAMWTAAILITIRGVASVLEALQGPAVMFGLPAIVLLMLLACLTWLLFCEPIWMRLGAYRLLGLKPHTFRELLHKWATRKPTPAPKS